MKNFEVTIKWLDDGTIQEGLLFKVGDIEDDDEDIFFYLDSERELEEFRKVGIYDWVILDVRDMDIQRRTKIKKL